MGGCGAQKKKKKYKMGRKNSKQAVADSEIFEREGGKKHEM